MCVKIRGVPMYIYLHISISIQKPQLHIHARLYETLARSHSLTMLIFFACLALYATAAAAADDLSAAECWRIPK